MLTVCWAAKGGSGTTVVSCALALLHARRAPTWLIDLAGDVPAALGFEEPSGAGILDWIASSADASALTAISVPACERLDVIPRGAAPTVTSNPRWAELGEHLAGLSTAVVIDAGTSPPPPSLAEVAQNRLLVTKPCYLSLRRSVGFTGPPPTGVVLVQEAGRALRADDVAFALQAPVVAEVTIDPAVARAVDAGLLVSRLPHSLAGNLRGLAA